MWSLITKSIVLFQFFQLSQSTGWGDYLTVNLTGTMNLILSAPHGGTIDTFSPSIPDRDHGCYVNGVCVFEHNCTGGPDPAK